VGQAKSFLAEFIGEWYTFGAFVLEMSRELRATAFPE